MPELELYLKGTKGQITARGYNNALERFYNALTSLNGDQDEPLTISNLTTGSLATTYNVSTHLADTVEHGLNHIREHQTLPKNWSWETAKHFSQLAKTDGKDGISGIELRLTTATVVIDQQLQNALNHLASHTRESISSLNGRLCAYSAISGKQPYARIETLDQPRTIRINIPDDHLSRQTATLLEKNVEIWGHLHRSAETNEVLHMNMLGISELNSTKATPPPMPVEHLTNLFPDHMAQQHSAVEWVRIIRDE